MNLSLSNAQGTPLTLLILYVVVALAYCGVIFVFRGRVQL